VHLVDFIIRIYHEARSPERQIHLEITKCILLLLAQFVVGGGRFDSQSLHITF